MTHYCRYTTNKVPTLSVYLAGPMSGVIAGETKKWRNHLKTSPRFIEGDSSKITWLDPTRNQAVADRELLTNDDLDEYRAHPLLRPKTILARDYDDVKRSDVVIAGLLPSYHGIVPISMGTCIEIGWCHAFQKILLVITPRKSEYRKHPMIASIATSFAETLEEAEDFLEAIMYENFIF